MIVSPTRERPRARIDRSSDRLVALASISIALAFLVAALAALALPPADRRGLWLPLHLALAGGASTAIAGVMPFFVAAFAAAQPAPGVLRWAGIVSVAGGALAAVAGVSALAVPLEVGGGILYILGICIVGLATILPARRALGPAGGFVTRAYLAALGSVVIGASVATLDLSGFGPIGTAWLRLKPAHAWLNLVGFASVVIVATLVHFFPTVSGTRIGRHTSGRVAVVGVSSGASIVAVGFAFAVDIVAALGALVAIAGAAALGVYAVRVWSTHGRWTTDLAWHRFVIGGLASAIGWFVVGIAIAGARVIAFGASPAAWSLEAVVAPLVVGWVGLAVLASASHLLPAVGPGDPVAHARQRAILGQVAIGRLVASNVGVAALAVGTPVGSTPLTGAGLVLVVASAAVSGVMLARALLIGSWGAIGVRRPAAP